jgi:hypothetical protein
MVPIPTDAYCCNISPLLLWGSEATRTRAIGADIESRSQTPPAPLRIHSKNPPWKPIFFRLTGRSTLPMFRAISRAAF